MRHLAIGFAAVLLSACASQPSTPAAAAAPADPAQPAMAQPATAQTASADDSQRLICVDELKTGSHLRRTQRICATAEEWARRRELHQRAVGDLGQRARQSAPSGN